MLIRLQGPDGREVEITVPEDCYPGKTVHVQVCALAGAVAASGAAGGARGSTPRNGNGAVGELVDVIRSTVEATRASIQVLQQRLADELTLQKALWASERTALRGTGAFNARGGERQLAVHSDDLSQTQALVFAAAEAGDIHQLLAALNEARRFSAVGLFLEDVVKEISSAEDSLVTWRCLLDALQARDRQEIEVWLEQCKGLGLEVPASMERALAEMYRREEGKEARMEQAREVHRRCTFALQADDPELLTEVFNEAHAAGLSEMPAAREVKQRYTTLRAEARRLRSMLEAGAASALPPPPPRPPQAPQAPLAPQAPQAPKASPQRGSDDARRGSLGATAPAPAQQRRPWQDIDSAAAAGAAAAAAAAGRRAEEKEAAAATDARTIKELIEECHRLGHDTRGCTGRVDLLRLLAGPPPSSATAAGGFRTSVPASSLNTQAGPSGARTVWGRTRTPAYLTTKRSQALYLLGFENGISLLTTAELRSAYRRAAMECHPDKIQNRAREVEAKELFQKVKAAYDYLQSPAAGIIR